MQLYHGDCLKEMCRIPDGRVDMVLCDLPYGMTRAEWDVKIPMDKLWAEYRRVIKPNGAICLFGQMPFSAELVMSNRKDFKYQWTWRKKRAGGFLNANRQPLRTTENILVFYRGQCKYNPQMRKGPMATKGSGRRRKSTIYNAFMDAKKRNDIYYPTDVLDFKAGTDGGRVHPTQKPVELLKYLIETYTDAGEVVLDNCMGSGSTGLACVQTGREFIGIEKDDGFFETAKKRIEEEVRRNASISEIGERIRGG